MIDKSESCKWCGVEVCFPTYPDIDGKPDLSISFCSDDCCDAWLNWTSGVDAPLERRADTRITDCARVNGPSITTEGGKTFYLRRNEDRMTVNGIQITQATIEATREWFAQNARDCVEGATTGKYHVNDLRKYIEWQSRREQEALNGDYDRSLTFIQRALYIQTGECPALLS